MSEKTRKKKDGEDKNKKLQRMREANEGLDQKNAAAQSGRPKTQGKTKAAHKIDSVRTGFGDFRRSSVK
jgi:hypothetical protein